jgi:ribosomal protein L4
MTKAVISSTAAFRAEYGRKPLRNEETFSGQWTFRNALTGETVTKTGNYSQAVSQLDPGFWTV